MENSNLLINPEYGIMELVNDDGTEFTPPENPLKEKWDRLYPPTPNPQASQVCDGYSCMWCGRCPRGEYWKVPEEDKEVYEQYKKDFEAYMREHNPDVYERLDSYREMKNKETINV